MTQQDILSALNFYDIKTSNSLNHLTVITMIENGYGKPTRDIIENLLRVVEFDTAKAGTYPFEEVNRDAKKAKIAEARQYFLENYS